MYIFIKRSLDILITVITILLFLPLILVISSGILLSSGLPVFYVQERVGMNWKLFKIFKFRTMVKNAENFGAGISSPDDPRITKIGKLLRKFKLDEIPQFFNVLLGNMSIVGPRPELMKYASYYKDDYSEILTVKPGITDFASIQFRNESDLLKGSENVENIYLSKILPRKISLYKKYLNQVNFATDFKIMFFTVKAIFK